ncbi:MAG: ArgE/DapE family deacylase [Terriglobia bacterium]
MEQFFQKVSNIVDSRQDELASFVQRLVQIPSLPGEEQAAQEFVAAKLHTLGLVVDVVRPCLEEVKDHPAFCDDGYPLDTRINIIGRWVGRQKGRSSGNENAGSLILNGHIDVVPPGKEDLWEESPWSGTIKDRRLYGRGSCDMKAGLSSAIFAIEALIRLGFEPEHDILLESVIGEETGGLGTLTTILKGYAADAAIILEPTSLALCPVQAGALTFRLSVPGLSTHASMKTTGVSAIEKFYLLLHAIEEFERRRHEHYQNPLYEHPQTVAPINIGTIKGGEWHSTVPNELVVEGRYGVFPGESIAAAKKSFFETIMSVAQHDPWLNQHPPILEWFEGQFEPGETDVAQPILRTLSAAHRQVTGIDPKVRGVSYGSDLRLFTNHARIPAVLYGPGNVVHSHSANEFVSLLEVVMATKILALAIYDWCGGEFAR